MGPLVSILVPNYNHGSFLDECLNSIFTQTYGNIEVILLDNQSSDGSLDVARRYRDKGLRINRNITNILNRSYRVLTELLARGEYLLLMGADDVLLPSFVEKAVSIMQRHPEVGYVHGERDFIAEDGTLTELEPFFNCSFIAQGRKIMPLYMVTTIAHPAQGIVRRSAFQRVEGYQREVDHMNADKCLWFYLSAVCDYAYIREKMCRIRVSSANQTSLGIKNFQHPVLCHMTINEFARYAEQFGFHEALARKEEALARLARECLGYAGAVLAVEDYVTAGAYLTYARVLDRGIENDERWDKLSDMLTSRRIDPAWIRAQDTAFAAHRRNYAPPEGFVPLTTEDLHA